uniref:Uncharacterized protein n=1 Tax=Cajanus cajan TaxID=3821 RepID=A0A151TNR1_CAJCA|nr:hypothetical protein KK1_022328 [Cajanus cajan]
MQPLLAGIMTLAACFVPRKAPTKFVLITRSKSDLLLSTMLGLKSSIIPVLLSMISSFPYLETAVFTAFSTSFSILTSQWT